MDSSVLRRITDLAGRERQLLAAAQGGQVGYPGRVTDVPDQLSALLTAVRGLEAAQVPYALIGGIAVGIRSGVPRATEDVDFAVPTTTDWTRLAAELAQAGLLARGIFPHSRNFVHQNGEPVQFAFDAPFDLMIERAERLQLGDLGCAVVTTADLIAMKRRAAADPARRPSKALRDRADIALLEGDKPDPDEGW
jgi:hypothetical protein